MSRRNLRAERRVELARAFVQVLGTHGREHATIAALAESAGIAPGLVHHYFENKQDLLSEVLTRLSADFRSRIPRDTADPLDAWVDAALALDQRSDVVAARAWVGLFAEALGDPILFARMRRTLDDEVVSLQRRSGESLSNEDASAVLAFVIGALVFGAFAPRKTSGFAARTLKRMIRTMGVR